MSLKTTPLTAWHVAKGAKMAPFAGFSMPIQYSSILAEHNHTREKAGIFDISHMGEFKISGSGATHALAGLLTHNFATLNPGRCRYGFMLNDRGGIIDDLIVYRLAEDDYMLVVNGAREDVDFAWIKDHLPAGVDLANISDQTSKIDLQGPASIDVLESVLGGGWRDLGYFSFREGSFGGKPLLVSRTGYTGELGYELYGSVETAPALWEKLTAHADVLPVGLGARDTLRLEVGLPLYGQDLDEGHTPVEAGYGFMLKSEADFIGKAGLENVRERLIALDIPGRRSARHDDAVTLREGGAVGRVTSGSFSPTLGHAVALAYVKAESADETEFLVKGARSELCATRVELPFYKDGTARVKLG